MMDSDITELTCHSGMFLAGIHNQRNRFRPMFFMTWTCRNDGVFLFMRLFGG
jgi:hypothetical protein